MRGPDFVFDQEPKQFDARECLQSGIVQHMMTIANTHLAGSRRALDKRQLPCKAVHHSINLATN